MTTLDVLLIESSPGIGDSQAETLRQAGHRVVRCYEPGARRAFPCRGIAEAGGCPLQSPVDVALVVRNGVLPRPTQFEQAATCAIRAHVPLVVDGSEALDPFEGWAAGHVVDGDVVGSCHRAVASHLEVMGEAIRSRLGDALGELGHPLDDVSCVVRTEGDRLLVDIVVGEAAGLPTVDERLRQTLSVRALDAVREQGWSHVSSVGIRVLASGAGASSET